jgi:hypothetical protein
MRSIRQQTRLSAALLLLALPWSRATDGGAAPPTAEPRRRRRSRATDGGAAPRTLRTCSTPLGRIDKLLDVLPGFDNLLVNREGTYYVLGATPKMAGTRNAKNEE